MSEDSFMVQLSLCISSPPALLFSPHLLSLYCSVSGEKEKIFKGEHNGRTFLLPESSIRWFCSSDLLFLSTKHALYSLTLTHFPIFRFLSFPNSL